MLYVTLFCIIFGAVAADPCPDVKVYNANGKWDNFLRTVWYFQMSYDHPWEEGSACNVVSFNVEDSKIILSSMRDGKPSKFEGDYKYEEDGGTLDIFSEVYKPYLGDDLLSIFFVYLDDDSFVMYGCKGDTEKEFLLAATSDPIATEEQMKKFKDFVASSDFIDENKLKKVDQSKATCKR